MDGNCRRKYSKKYYIYTGSNPVLTTKINCSGAGTGIQGGLRNHLLRVRIPPGVQNAILKGVRAINIGTSERVLVLNLKKKVYMLAYYSK